MVRKGGTYTPCVPRPIRRCMPAIPRTCIGSRRRRGPRSATQWQAGALVESVDVRQRVEAAARPGGRVPAGDRRRSRSRFPRREGAIAYVDAVDRRGRCGSCGRSAMIASMYIVGALAEFARRRVLQRGRSSIRRPTATSVEAWLVEIDGDGQRAKGDVRRPRAGCAPTKCYGTYFGERSEPPDRGRCSNANGTVVLPPQSPTAVRRCPASTRRPRSRPMARSTSSARAYGNDRYSYVMSVNPGYFDVNWAARCAIACSTAAASTSRTVASSALTATCNDAAPTGVTTETGFRRARSSIRLDVVAGRRCPTARVLYGSSPSTTSDARPPVRILARRRRSLAHVRLRLGPHAVGRDVRRPTTTASSSRTTTTASTRQRRRSGPVLPDDARTTRSSRCGCTRTPTR